MWKHWKCRLCPIILGLTLFIFDISGASTKLDGSIFSESLRSPTLFIVILCALSSTIPLICNILAEIVINPDKHDDLIEKISLLMSFYAGAIVILAGSSIAHLADVMTTILQYQFVIGVSAVACLMRLYDPETFTKLTLHSLLAILYTIAVLVKVYALDRSNTIIPSLILTLRVVVLAFLYYKFFIWLRGMWISYSSSKLSIRNWYLNWTYHQTMGARIFIFASTALIPLTFIALFSQQGSVMIGNQTVLHTALYVVFYNLYLYLLIEIPGASASENFKLKRKLDAKAVSVMYQGHEMNDVLETVCVSLELVEKRLQRYKARIPEEIFSYIAELRTYCENDIQRLNDLLTYEKLEAGGLMLDKCRVKPVEYTQSIIRTFYLAASNAGLQLEALIDNAAGEALVSASISIDEKKMSQALRNILGSAVKFSDRGSKVAMKLSVIDAEITAVTSRRPSRLMSFKNELTSNRIKPEGCVERYFRIEVQGAGRGLSRLQIDKLLGETAPDEAEVKQQGGSLGFWISKKIVDMHGGKVDLIGNGDEGYCCYIDIPLNTVYLASLKANDAPPPPITSEDIPHQGLALDVLGISDSIEELREVPSQSAYDELESSANICDDVAVKMKKSIRFNFLVVDDSSAVRSMVKSVIRSAGAGHTVSEAVDGADAINAFLESSSGRSYDAIFIDDAMPNMNGEEATKHLRELGYQGMIVGLSSPTHSSGRLVDGCADIGIDRFMMKPLDIAEVNTIIEDLLERQISAVDNID